MHWHKDLCMFDPPQIEMVYTIENKNDYTEFIWKQDNQNIHVQPKPNDVVFVVPNRADHCVTPLQGKGRRRILKFIAHSQDSVPNDHFFVEMKNGCPTL